MLFEKFDKRIEEINLNLFEDYDAGSEITKDSLGSRTRAKINGNQKSILVININPNPKGDSKDSDNGKSPHPLIYVPEIYDENLRKYLEQQKLTWNSFKSPYDLVADKVKMFWTTDDKYKEEIGEYYPEYKEIFEKCYKEESEKETNLVLVFAELFYLCERTQTNVIKHLNKNKENTLSKIDEIIKLYIEYYNPKLIVITNMGASRLVYKSQNTQDKSMKNMENEIMISYNGNKIPCLFSKMLFGQWRATNTEKEKLKQRIGECI